MVSAASSAVGVFANHAYDTSMLTLMAEGEVKVLLVDGASKSKEPSKSQEQKASCVLRVTSTSIPLLYRT